MGIRLNRAPPNIYFRKRKTGGVSINSTIPLTHMDDKLIQRVLQVGSGTVAAHTPNTHATPAARLVRDMDDKLIQRVLQVWERRNPSWC